MERALIGVALLTSKPPRFAVACLPPRTRPSYQPLARRWIARPLHGLLTSRALGQSSRFYATDRAFWRLRLLRTPVRNSQKVVEVGMLSIARTRPSQKRNRGSVRRARSRWNRPASTVANDRFAAGRTTSLAPSVPIDTSLRTNQEPIDTLGNLWNSAAMHNRAPETTTRDSELNSIHYLDDAFDR